MSTATAKRKPGRPPLPQEERDRRRQARLEAAAARRKAAQAARRRRPGGPISTADVEALLERWRTDPPLTAPTDRGVSEQAEEYDSGKLLGEHRLFVHVARLALRDAWRARGKVKASGRRYFESGTFNHDVNAMGLNPREVFAALERECLDVPTPQEKELGMRPGGTVAVFTSEDRHYA